LVVEQVGLCLPRGSRDVVRKGIYIPRILLGMQASLRRSHVHGRAGHMPGGILGCGQSLQLSLLGTLHTAVRCKRRGIQEPAEEQQVEV
jgi:hypothetical protein